MVVTTQAGCPLVIVKSNNLRRLSSSNNINAMPMTAVIGLITSPRMYRSIRPKVQVPLPDC